jgi:hypothetical protein
MLHVFFWLCIMPVKIKVLKTGLKKCRHLKKWCSPRLELQGIIIPKSLEQAQSSGTGL